MNYIGIDIGSTCAKVVAMDDLKKIVYKDLRPTGWSSVDTSKDISRSIKDAGLDMDDSKIVATGYGRVSVPYADKTITEISCHGLGAGHLFDINDGLVIDIGGQDTKIIELTGGMVTNFMMNDKCSAGTGRFLEVMSNSLGMSPLEICEFARGGSGVRISSMCTVFAESEVISLIGRGESRENIAFAVVDSIADKVASQAKKFSVEGRSVILTGGLCECDYLREILSSKIRKEIQTSAQGRYAGAVGAALSAMKLK